MYKNSWCLDIYPFSQLKAIYKKFWMRHRSLPRLQKVRFNRKNIHGVNIKNDIKVTIYFLF